MICIDLAMSTMRILNVFKTLMEFLTTTHISDYFLLQFFSSKGSAPFCNFLTGVIPFIGTGSVWWFRVTPPII